MKPRKKVTKGSYDMDVDDKSVQVKGKTVERFDKSGEKTSERFKAKGNDEIKKVKTIKKKNKDGEMLVKKSKTVYK